MKPLKHSDYIKAYLVYQVGTPVLAGFISVFIGIILGAILAAAKVPPSQGKVIGLIVGLTFAIPFGYFMFRAIVNKFIVAKVQEETRDRPNQSLEPTAEPGG